MRVSIVGAGIGGLTLAAALNANGIRSRVFEQAPRLGEVGAGIQLAPNASRLLHRLGLTATLGRMAVRPEAIELRRWNDNQVLARTTLGSACTAMYEAPYYTVHRAELHSALLGLVPDGVELDHRCVGVEQAGDEVLIHFANGAVVRSDVVIGADGIHSTVRDTMVADAPRRSGQAIYRSLVSVERLGSLGVERKVVLWLGPGQHCVCYPIASGRLVSFGATVPDSGRHIESWSETGRVEDLSEAYRGWHGEVRRIIAAVDTVGRWALHDRDPVERWVDGPVAIMGDAAHAMLPFLAQGANQAIEDALALARCLRDVPDVSGALRRYQGVRRARTARIQRLSRANSTTLHLTDGTAQRRRDAYLADMENLRGKAELFGYDAESAVA